MLIANFELSLHSESSIPRHSNYFSSSCLSFTHSLTFNEFPITHLSSSATHVNRCVYARMLLLCYYSGRPSPSLTLIEHNRQPNEQSGLRRATATTATGHQSYTNLFTKLFCCSFTIYLFYFHHHCWSIQLIQRVLACYNQAHSTHNYIWGAVFVVYSSVWKMNTHKQFVW